MIGSTHKTYMEDETATGTIPESSENPVSIKK